ncbi:MAG: hypothetical protein CVU18_01945 [Betaproteobacteria bacterium HGW-Betaproteobacteria-12]|nr:MAG: hypothetical protein CVU18_01945 [Betaproteobacteria bacterium HGW-Betaproteobacteria-12]
MPMLRLLMLFALLLGSAAAPAGDWQVREKFATPFADARDAIVMGIESRGLVINYTSHIGEMLQRTGADLGASKRIFVQAEIVEFCSAKLSRQMMEADPHNIVLCPFAISIYTLPGEPGVTWVAYRRPPPAVAAIVGPLLADIAAEAGR